MEKAGGYVLLFGIVFLAIGAWRGIFGIEDALAAALTGAAFVLAGFFMVNGIFARRPGPATAEPPGAPTEPEQSKGQGPDSGTLALISIGHSRDD